MINESSTINNESGIMLKLPYPLKSNAYAINRQISHLSHISHSSTISHLSHSSRASPPSPKPHCNNCHQSKIVISLSSIV